MLRVISVAIFVFLLIRGNIAAPKSKEKSGKLDISSGCSGTDESEVPAWPEPSSIPMGKYRRAAVTAFNGFCSEIGRDAMIQGGNVVDAAIATMICTGLLDAQSSGIGGGHFMTIFNSKTGSCYVIDARETAPKASNQDMFKDVKDVTQGSQIGWKSIGVPGQIHGLWTAYKKFGSGKIKWSALIQPTIDLAEKGYIVTPDLAHGLRSRTEPITKDSTLNIYINPDTGELYKSGEVMKRPLLAKTLRQIAESSDPVQLFYNGSLAATFVKEFKANGGLITAEDMAGYTSIVREEVMETTVMNKYGMCGPPPPSSAAVAQSLLKIIDNFGVTPANTSTVDGNLAMYHRLIEAMKFAFAKRSLLGDMDHVGKALGIARDITSERYTKWAQEKITGKAEKDSYYQGEKMSKQGYGTSHMNTIDSEGNAVSTTATINLYMGSMRRSLEMGVIWNDEMDDFSTPGLINAFGFVPSPCNFIKPGKRPMSSMSPTIVFNKDTRKFKMAVGAAGGSRIITSVATTLIRALMLEQTVKAAIDSPRLHNQWRPAYTHYEEGFPELYLKQLKDRGQTFELRENESWGTAIIKADDGFIYASTDWRRGSTSFSSGY